MIKIGAPYIEQDGELTYLKSAIENEGEKKNITLFYAVEKKYEQYLCHETADAFVLPMLLRAIVSGQDIEVDALLSEKLYHNLTNSVMYILWLSKIKAGGRVAIKNNKDTKAPQIRCKGISNQNFNGEAVGTGCSLGVDGYSVIKKYIFENEMFPSYKPTHLACFNVGAFGSYNTDETRQSFYDELKNLNNFAQKFDIPIVSIDTNVHEFYPERRFNWSVTFLNIGCVLSMQKLWRRYLFASGYSVKNFEFDFNDCCKSDSFLCPHLSTESVEVLSADMNLTRSDKVRNIMNDVVCKENLNVCLKVQRINNGVMARNVSNYINCGRCEKCLRTMLQLDIYGVLDDYNDIFDMTSWKKLKPIFLSKILAYRKENIMYKDILDTMSPDYHIPIFSRLFSIIYKPCIEIYYRVTCSRLWRYMLIIKKKGLG